MSEHPMTPAMRERIKRIHDALISPEHAPNPEELEGDFLDLLDSLAGNEGADAKRAATEAVDEYMDDWDEIGAADTGNDSRPTTSNDPLRERFATE